MNGADAPHPWKPYKEHVEHPAEFAVAFRYIELRPPEERRIKALPPEGATRYRLLPPPPLGLLEPADLSAPPPLYGTRVVEYLQYAKLSVWAQVGPDTPDLEREEVVRIGWYKVYATWFWSEEPKAAAVPPDVMGELMAAAMRDSGGGL